jgi:hypothetical protein
MYLILLSQRIRVWVAHCPFSVRLKRQNVWSDNGKVIRFSNSLRMANLVAVFVNRIGR